jgi:hypothetical protein
MHLDRSLSSPSLTFTSSNEGSLTTASDSDTPFREDMLRNTIPVVRDVVHIIIWIVCCHILIEPLNPASRGCKGPRCIYAAKQHHFESSSFPPHCGCRSLLTILIC